MKAQEIFNRRVILDVDAFADLVVWKVPQSVPGSSHSFKYRLAFVVNGLCVLRYDNEAGKGGHKHVGNKEMPYKFTTPAKLIADFWNDVTRWQHENRDT